MLGHGKAQEAADRRIVGRVIGRRIEWRRDPIQRGIVIECVVQGQGEFQSRPGIATLASGVAKRRIERGERGGFDLVDPIGHPAPIVGEERRAKRSDEHTSELQSLMRISYAVFCLKKKTNHYSIILQYKPYTHT